jgi:hypothetical protein
MGTYPGYPGQSSYPGYGTPGAFGAPGGVPRPKTMAEKSAEEPLLEDEVKPYLTMAGSTAPPPMPGMPPIITPPAVFLSYTGNQQAAITRLITDFYKGATKSTINNIINNPPYKEQKIGLLGNVSYVFKDPKTTKDYFWNISTNKWDPYTTLTWLTGKSGGRRMKTKRGKHRRRRTHKRRKTSQHRRRS